MSDIHDQYRQITEDLKPFYHALVQAAHEKGLTITGFVYGDIIPEAEDPYLIRFGNLKTQTPQDTFQINYQLAMMCARLELEGKADREVIQTAPDGRVKVPAPKAPAALDIADKLLVTLLATPLDALSDETQTLMESYLASRRPPVPESGK